MATTNNQTTLARLLAVVASLHRIAVQSSVGAGVDHGALQEISASIGALAGEIEKEQVKRREEKVQEDRRREGTKAQIRALDNRVRELERKLRELGSEEEDDEGGEGDKEHPIEVDPLDEIGSGLVNNERPSPPRTVQGSSQGTTQGPGAGRKRRRTGPTMQLGGR